MIAMPPPKSDAPADNHRGVETSTGQTEGTTEDNARGVPHGSGFDLGIEGELAWLGIVRETLHRDLVNGAKAKLAAYDWRRLRNDILNADLVTLAETCGLECDTKRIEFTCPECGPDTVAYVLGDAETWNCSGCGTWSQIDLAFIVLRRADLKERFRALRDAEDVA